jgi:hypothetical protein
VLYNFVVEVWEVRELLPELPIVDVYILFAHLPYVLGGEFI